MKLLAVAFAAAALLGGAHGTTSTSLIVFAADRAPSISGEVFRADWNGRVVNLTHSPWRDTQPVVSPDGRRIAFLSDRGGAVALWLMRIDGSGLTRVPTVRLPRDQYVQIAWSPQGTTIALTANGELSLAAPGGHPRALARAAALGSLWWSPDGTIIVVHTEGSVDAYTPAGARAWSVSAGPGGFGWSAQGLFATGAYDGRIHVVDESGRQRFSVPATTASWSPDGTKLATMNGHRGSLWTSTGRLVSSKRYASSETVPTWTSPTHVVFGPAPDAGLNTTRSGTTFAVRDGTHVYAHVIGCDDDGGPSAAIASLQRVPGTRSIVYASYCAEPLDNLYAMTGDGSGLRRLTSVQAQETTPRISPDRTQIAYEYADATGLTCKGCPTSIRTLHVDGSPGATLTSPPDCTFDVSPSWSPDGTQISYSHSSCSTPPTLFTMQASGVAATSLDVEASETAWGPKRIAYYDGATAPSSIWTIAPDGTGATKAGWGNVLSPAWSADGRLAYLSGTNVVVVGRKLPLPFAQVRSLAWSPDGTRLLVAARPKNGPTFDLYTVKTDGTDPRRLTTDMDVSSADWR